MLSVRVQCTNAGLPRKSACSDTSRSLRLRGVAWNLRTFVPGGLLHVTRDQACVPTPSGVEMAGCVSLYLCGLHACACTIINTHREFLSSVGAGPEVGGVRKLWRRGMEGEVPISYCTGAVRIPSLVRHKQCPLLPQSLVGLLGSLTELG